MSKLKSFTFIALALIFSFGPVALIAQQISGGGGGGGTPGGSNTQVQYNSSGTFAGNAGLLFDPTGFNAASELFTIGGSAGLAIGHVTGSGWYFCRADVLSLTGQNCNMFQIWDSGSIKTILPADGFLDWAANTAPNNNWATGTRDVGLTRNAAGVIEVNSSVAGTFREAKLRSLVIGGSVPVDGGGSCTATAFAGGGTAGTFTAPTCAAGTIIITFAFTAPTGWACQASDRTTASDTLKQTASSTTSATFAATTANNDVVSYSCVAY